MDPLFLGLAQAFCLAQLMRDLAVFGAMHRLAFGTVLLELDYIRFQVLDLVDRVFELPPIILLLDHQFLAVAVSCLDLLVLHLI